MNSSGESGSCGKAREEARSGSFSLEFGLCEGALRYPERVSLLYRLAKPLVRWWVASIVRSRFEGMENLPGTGAYILVPNHQSLLDPLLLQGSLPRPVYSMTKSTQFIRRFFRWALPRLHAFPVRRYRVDPQSVRVLFRRLQEGRVVCVYPEGERTWDGRIQPFRRGTIRVLLRAGVPVIPVGIEGTYDAWPRWASGPRRGFTARIRIGKPMALGVHRGRTEREAALPATDAMLRDALLELSGEAARQEMEIHVEGSGSEALA